MIKCKVGQKYNHLTIIEKSERNTNKKSYWICKCECGNISTVQSYDLTRNKTISCNDCGNKRIGEKNKKHDSYKIRLYRTWSNMKTRCNNSNYEMYKSYGGKGIKVCEEWNEFIVFKDWALNNGYKENLTLDRINNDKSYCPENCRWATMKVQQNNRTNNNMITFKGETLTMKQWSEKLGILYTTIQRRMKKKWPIEKVLSKKYFVKREEDYLNGY